MPTSGIFLPTDRIRYEGQLTLLRAYAAIAQKGAQAVTNDDIAEYAQIKSDTASLANQFFAKSNLIKWVGGGYLPTDAVVRYQRAFELRDPEAGHHLKSPLAETWFWRGLERQLNGRNPLTVDDAIRILRDVAEVGKAADSKLQILLEYLMLAGLIRIVGNNVYLASEDDPVDETNPEYGARGYAPFVFETKTRGVFIHIEVDPVAYGWTENALTNHLKMIAHQIAGVMNMDADSEE